MSNFYELRLCEDCNQMTNHVMHDAASVEQKRGPRGESYKAICQKCKKATWVTEV